MFQIYFGFCFIAFASAIYSLACPSIIKRYASAIDLGAATTGAVGDYAYTIVEREVLESKYADEYRANKRHFQQMVSQDFSIEQAQFEVNNALINIYFALKNLEKPVWRWLSRGVFRHWPSCALHFFDQDIPARRCRFMSRHGRDARHHGDLLMAKNARKIEAPVPRVGAQCL